MNQDIIGLLKKYAGNNCTPEELEQVRQILRSGEYEEEWSAVIAEEANEDPELNEPDFDSERLFSRINSTIEPGKKSIPYQWIAGIAAALLISLSIGYLSLNNHLFKTEQVSYARQTTKAGEQKIITLADGSRIILNNASKLSYPTVFPGDKREVYLNGEAFFEVRHDSSRPFLVHAGHLKVQVLGTSFNIKSYQADHQTTVSVTTGKVGVNSIKPSATYMLLPSDQLSYTDRNAVFKKTKISLGEISSWQKGILVFHQESIGEIRSVLQRWYNVSVTVDRETLLSKRVTASFTRKPLPEVLEILSQTAGFTYTINKNEVHIH